MKHVSPDQGSLLIQDPITGTDVLNPSILEDSVQPLEEGKLDYDPAKYDPNPGLSTPLAEGWLMLHKTINDIARARSNIGFTKLPEGSKPVRKFAYQANDVTPTEAMELVEGTVKRGSHYRTAQHRLNAYRDKQVKRTLAYNALHRIAPDEVISPGLLPMDVGTVDHKFFYANDPAIAVDKMKKRATIARFVRKHAQ